MGQGERPGAHWGGSATRGHGVACRRAAFPFALAAGLVLGGDAGAQRLAYWLTKPGTDHVSSCPGKTAGEPLKIGRDLTRIAAQANDDDRWLLVAGLVTCRDAGSEFTYEIEFLNVGVNPTERANLVRDVIAFDWVGLAAYRGAAGNQAIEWLYDEAKPVRGALKREDVRKISFGDLTFRVPKQTLAAASHFTFYLVAEGLLWHVPVL